MTGFAVKEIFLTLQGEGVQAGRAAVFCRFAGCNLWSGREADRAAAACKFCDTAFVGTDGSNGGRYQNADDLANAIEREWTGGKAYRFCVLTGGEPLLQVDGILMDALHRRGFQVGVETNGTVARPRGIDWLCVSPKSRCKLAIAEGNELKLVFPQHDAPPERFRGLAFERFLLQPMDGAELEKNTRRAVEYCLKNPQWRLSVQTHKHIGIR
jgi:7-carboxy-7-deazaguanine synthase (Cx14CxxC type)